MIPKEGIQNLVLNSGAFFEPMQENFKKTHTETTENMDARFRGERYESMRESLKIFEEEQALKRIHYQKENFLSFGYYKYLQKD